MNDEAKKLMLAKEEVQATLVSIGRGTHANPGLELAALANEPYDPEVPIPEIIGAVFATASVDPGEDYDYFVQAAVGKTVYTVSSGSVTQTNVTADSENTLSFSDYDSAEEYIYLKALLEAKYDIVAVKAEAQQEVLNRLEIKAVLDLLLAAAVAQSNTYAWDSGDTAITPEKIVEMVKSIKKYGKKIVMIAGSDVDTDIRFLDFTYNKQREVDLKKLGVDEYYDVETFQYTHSTTQTVLAAGKMILVAVSDVRNNKPGHFVRRKIATVTMDQTAVNKERLVITSGPAKHVGSARKVAIGILTYENFGAVVTNPFTVAAFNNDTSYA